MGLATPHCTIIASVDTDQPLPESTALPNNVDPSLVLLIPDGRVHLHHASPHVQGIEPLQSTDPPCTRLHAQKDAVVLYTRSIAIPLGLIDRVQSLCSNDLPTTIVVNNVTFVALTRARRSLFSSSVAHHEAWNFHKWDLHKNEEEIEETHSRGKKWKEVVRGGATATREGFSWRINKLEAFLYPPLLRQMGISAARILRRYACSSSSTRVRSAFSRYIKGFSTSPEVGNDSGDECFGRHIAYPDNKKLVQLPSDDHAARHIPIKAYFFCTSIDLKTMQAEHAYNVVPPTSRSINYVALRFCDYPSEIVDMGVIENFHRYVVVFQYGSAVLFNVTDDEAEGYLEIIRKYATGLLPDMRKDDYAVVEKPLLMTWMQGGPDHIVLKNLDADGIRIIGSVLGQSIALDHYIRQVDGMIEEFTDINRIMEKTGTFTMERKKLFQLVGKANSNLADVILKLGLFDRSEIAWRNAHYDQILEYLREEFELTQRFGSLNFKLKFVEHNMHFLQEVLQKRKSDFLEWCIIVLLAVDNMISIYEIVQESGVPSP
ncbi:protein RETARDED ROOT GROWTH, mitochondrial-like [Wolffia australiana]